MSVVVCLLILWVTGFFLTREQRRRERMRRDVVAADRRVRLAHHRARRAMNDAAGQSWRNLADGGPFA